MFSALTRKHLSARPKARYVGFAAILSALAFAVPMALGASITPANGKEFLLPTGNLYQLDSKGVYRLVPDLQTANEMGVLWSGVKHVDSVGPIGSPLRSVLTLPGWKVTTVAPKTMANGKDYIVPGGSIFQMDAKGVYHLVPDVLTAQAMKVDMAKLIHVKSVKPIGAPLESVVVNVARVCTKQAANATTKANGADYLLPNGNLYQLSGGSYHLVPDVATAVAMGIQWDKVHRVSTLGPVGTPIASVCLS